MLDEETGWKPCMDFPAEEQTQIFGKRMGRPPHPTQDTMPSLQTYSVGADAPISKIASPDTLYGLILFIFPAWSLS